MQNLQTEPINYGLLNCLKIKTLKYNWQREIVLLKIACGGFTVNKLSFIYSQL